MAAHRGPQGPDPTTAATLDDAAAALLAVWEAARAQADIGLSDPQLNALLIVERHEGVNLPGLASGLQMILSSASRLCDRLVAADLLERRVGAVDRREITLFLTARSSVLLRMLHAARQDMLADVLVGMPPATRTALLVGLAEFATAVRGGAQVSVVRDG